MKPRFGDRTASIQEIASDDAARRTEVVMPDSVTITLGPLARLLTLNLLSGRIDSLRRWRSERINAGLIVTGLDSQIAELCALRAQIAPPRARQVIAAETAAMQAASATLAPRIADLQAALSL